jgi:hypothetical protein
MIFINDYPENLSYTLYVVGSILYGVVYRQ